jgi:hypothetical protein
MFMGDEDAIDLFDTGACFNQANLKFAQPKAAVDE